jgi:BACON domain-containing protein
MNRLRKTLVAGLLLLAVMAIVPFISPYLAWAEDGGSSTLSVTPTSLSFSYQQGGTLPSSKTLSVSSSNYTSFTAATSGASWLSISKTSGTTPTSISVSVRPGTMAAGTYRASITLTSRAGSVNVPVTMTITAATTTRLVVSPTSLSFSYQQGGSTPASQSLSVTSSTSTAINFTDSKSSASWLTISRTSGTTPSSIGVSVNASGLAVGTYNASIALSSSAGSITVPVTLSVTNSTTAHLVVSPSTLAFGFTQGGTAPGAQNISVTSSTGSAISFTDSKSSASWLTISRTSGTTPITIGVSVAPGTLAAGTYTASVSVSSNAGSATVPVTLTVTASGGGGSASGYALLAWSELGMHCLDGKDYSVFSVLPPYNTVYAKLVTKGSQPAPVTTGVTLTYVAMRDAAGSINTTSYGNSTVAQKTNFWSYVRTLFGGAPPQDVGLHNWPVQSLTPAAMEYDSTKGLWKAEGIPVVPYDDSGASNAYPMIQVVAKSSTGATLATATVVIANSDEMSCNRCHAPNTNNAAMPSGGWITQYSPAQNIKLNILKKHDDRHSIPAAVLSAAQAKGYTGYQASLYQTALNGGALNNPILCAACHASNALNAAGLSTGVTDASGNQMVPALTSSMHSLHASATLPGSTATLDNATDPANSCYLCHPGTVTKCQRGTMSNIACFNCHGNLSRVGQPTRAGWLDEPNCQMCHQNGTTYTTAFTSTNIGPTGTQRTSTDLTFATQADHPATGFSLYRFSQGHGALECSACHGSQHAEFPTNQPNDQVYSTNLQGYAGRVTECATCHTTSFATSTTGGPHGLHTVGQAWVSAHQGYAGGRQTQCAYCHGADYRGTTRSALLTAKTLNGKSFPAGHQMNCYDCHNGPNPD